MSKLLVAVKQMESTRASTDPVKELRQWRIQAEKRFLGVVVKAAKLPSQPPQKPRGK